MNINLADIILDIGEDATLKDLQDHNPGDTVYVPKTVSKFDSPEDRNEWIFNKTREGKTHTWISTELGIDKKTVRRAIDKHCAKLWNQGKNHE
jgi:hypothetical protein